MINAKNNKLTVRSKVWLELDGVPFIGQGRLAVLHAIDQHGSMVKAAEETCISYRRIKGIVREMEAQLGVPIVVTQRGGEHGGWTVLTPAARDLMQRFERQQDGIRDEIDEVFNQLFNDYFKDL